MQVLKGHKFGLILTSIVWTVVPCEETLDLNSPQLTKYDKILVYKKYVKVWQDFGREQKPKLRS